MSSVALGCYTIVVSGFYLVAYIPGFLNALVCNKPLFVLSTLPTDNPTMLQVQLFLCRIFSFLQLWCDFGSTSAKPGENINGLRWKWISITFLVSNDIFA